MLAEVNGRPGFSDLQVHLFIICHSYTAKLPPKSISAKDSRSPENLLAVPAGEQAVASICRLECHQTITTGVTVINTEIRTDSFRRWIQTQTTEQIKAGVHVSRIKLQKKIQ